MSRINFRMSKMLGDTYIGDSIYIKYRSSWVNIPHISHVSHYTKSLDVMMIYKFEFKNRFHTL